MLHLKPIPNPITEAFRTYKMTNVGKAVVATTLAKAVYEFLEVAAEQNSAQTKYTPKPPTNYTPMNYESPVPVMTVEQEAWYFYGQILKAIQVSNNIPWWNSMSKNHRQEYMLYIFLHQNKGHLVPILRSQIFHHI